LPVAGFVLTFLGKKSRRAGREGQSRMADMYNTIHEALAAMPIVKVFENEKKEIDHFKKQNRHYFDAVMKLVRVEARSSPIMEAIGAVILAFMLSVGGMDVIHGKWSAGSFVAYIYAALSLYGPIKSFAAVNVRIQQSLAAAERVFQLIDEKGTIADQPGAMSAETIRDNIEFRNVSFSYPTGLPVLDSLSLTIKKGEIIALVGPSGSGKTTIAQLLLRFYDPTEGAVLIDGHDFRQVTLHSLRQQTAVVTQETHLFNDTVYSNIAYGKPNATRDEVEAAAKAAYAHDFISAFQNGYDTIIGERGARVSGGEKQRIAIARALLKNPAILILDEATSALDTASEQMVQRALDRLLEGRTVLMIAHRLSTVRRADRIVVLEKGRIKEVGSHEQLLDHKGAYHQLIQMQTSV
jgi:subfamily B ATP-binding cassette protein MsbA